MSRGPAGAFDYFVRGPADTELHIELVSIVYGDSYYEIGYRASPSAYGKYVGALNEVISRWRWTTPPAPVTVSSTDGTFTTVVPAGFRMRSPRPGILYTALGPRAGGRTINIVVSSGSSNGASADTIIRRSLALLVTKRHAFGLSRSQSLTVDGDQARSAGWLLRLGHTVNQWRAVIVVHGGVAYSILYTSVPSAFAAHLGALREVITAWHGA